MGKLKFRFIPFLFLFLPLQIWADFAEINAAYSVKDFTKAIELSREFLKTDSTNIDVRLILARSLHIQGEKGKAWEEIEKSLTFEKSAYVYETASDLARWEKRFDSALKYMKMAMAQDKKNNRILIAKYIRLLKLIGRLEEANTLALKFEKLYGTQYQNYYQDESPNIYSQEIALEGGLADTDQESRMRRILMISYFNKNSFVDFGFRLIRNTKFQEVGLNFSADAYFDIPIGKLRSYAHVSAARSNKKVFPDYSLASDYHLIMGQQGEVGVGYTYRDYGSILGRTWNLSALAYLRDFIPAITYYWGPSDFIKDSESWLLSLTWTIDEKWTVAPYFSFGREVDESASDVFSLINFKEWGGLVSYNFNLSWGLNTFVWLRKEKLANIKPRDEAGGTLRLTYYFH